MGGSKSPAPAPVPTADPIAVQAQFEAGASDDELSTAQKKAQGKKSLVVKRDKKTSGTAGLSSEKTRKGSGLAVGKV